VRDKQITQARVRTAPNCPVESEQETRKFVATLSRWARNTYRGAMQNVFQELDAPTIQLSFCHFNSSRRRAGNRTSGCVLHAGLRHAQATATDPEVDRNSRRVSIRFVHVAGCGERTLSRPANHFRGNLQSWRMLSASVNLRQGLTDAFSAGVRLSELMIQSHSLRDGHAE
jgi:hypothetical protein